MWLKNESAPYPKTRKGAELIVKQNCEYTSDDAERLTSGVFVLGNREGFRWLSEYFAWLADRIAEDAPYSSADPDDHQHLDSVAPINHQLSDEMGLLIGSFSNKNRRRVLKACGVARSKRVPGNPVTQFSSRLEWITQLLADQPGDQELHARTIRQLALLIQQSQESVARLKAVAEISAGNA